MKYLAVYDCVHGVIYKSSLNIAIYLLHIQATIFQGDNILYLLSLYFSYN